MKASLIHYFQHWWQHKGNHLYSDQEIIVRASHDGVQTHPPNDGPTTTQRDINGKAEQEISKNRRHYAETADKSRQALDEYQLTISDLDISKLIESAKHKFKRSQLTFRELYVKFRERVRIRKQALDNFCTINKLSRPADYPDSWIWALSLPIFLILVEAIINFQLFARADPFGAPGGFMTALNVSIVNVGTSLAFGYLVFSNVFNTRRWISLPARVVMIAYVFAIIRFNLWVADYRGALTGDADPLFSILLLVVGLLAATLALLDGYWGIDDRYFWYGRVDRKCKQADGEFEGLKDTTRREIETVLDETEREVTEGLIKLDEKTALANGLIDHAVGYCLSDCEENVRSIDKRSGALQSLYREYYRNVSGAPVCECVPVLDTSLGASSEELRENKRRLNEAAAAKHREAAAALAELRLLGEREIEAIYQYCPEENVPPYQLTDGDTTPHRGQS